MITSHGGDLVFLGGAPRSGTTLLQQILDSHSLIYGGPEFDHIPKTIELWESYRRSYFNGRTNHYYRNESEIDQRFRQLIVSIFNNTLSLKKKKILSEKTPFNTLLFDQLYQLFPESKFIQIIRQPSDVVNSLRNVRRNAIKHNKRVPHLSKSILTSIRLIKPYYFHPKIPDEKILFIKYEDLVANKIVEINRVCKFLEIDFDPKMLRHEMYQHDVAKVYDNVWYSKQTIRGKTTTRVQKDSLPRTVRLFIDQRFRDTRLYQTYYQTKDEFFWSILAIPYLARSYRIKYWRSIKMALGRLF